MEFSVLPARFTSELLDWWQDHKRDLPWKKSSDPYNVWVSEIILQQTRVEQGKKYFERFLHTFPTLQSLAAAPEDLLLKTWEGLGYYNRARNMHQTAKYLVQDHHGLFPETYHGLLQLKGIGPYTAAAIASFSFGLPHPVVDGNVLRLISRVKGITSDIQQQSTIQEILQFLEQAIAFVSPADFNQAMMDFGSIQCTPGRPNCHECVLSKYCKAFHEEKTTEIPVKKKKPPLQKRFLHFLDLQTEDGYTILQQRSSEEIWPRLFQLPYIESDEDISPSDEEITNLIFSLTEQTIPAQQKCRLIVKTAQILSHQKIYGNFYKLKLNKLNIIKNTDLYLVKREKVSKFAFPKLVSDYIKSSDYLKDTEAAEHLE